jgi:hypothetical protein
MFSILTALSYLLTVYSFRHGLYYPSLALKVSRTIINMQTNEMPQSPLRFGPITHPNRRFMTFSVALLSGILISGPINAESQYLKEPTPAFVAEEAKQKEFRAQQGKIRAEWESLVTTFEAAQKPEDIAETLKSMNTFIKEKGIAAGKPY